MSRSTIGLGTAVFILTLVTTIFAGCTSPNCGNSFCSPPNDCCNEICMQPCPNGYSRDSDCTCYPNDSVKCDCGGFTHCEAGGECINNKWVEKCPSGYFRGDDGSCYPVGSVKCNCGGFTYCEAGGTCCNNVWTKCPSGYYLGLDCVCRRL